MSKTNKCVKKYIGKKGPKFKKLLRDLVKFSRQHSIKPITDSLGNYEEGQGGTCCALGALGVMCRGNASYGYNVGDALFGSSGSSKVAIGNDRYTKNGRAKNPFTLFGRQFQLALRNDG